MAHVPTDLFLREPYVGCGADRGGCGCMGLLDCVHDDRLERALAVIEAAVDEGLHIEMKADARRIALAVLTAGLDNQMLDHIYGERWWPPEDRT